MSSLIRSPLCRVRQRYGRLKGFCRHCLWIAICRLGGLRRFKRIDWGRVHRLVFTCRGNTCRSPYAEAKARSFGIEASSFGLAADGRSSADPTALEVAGCRGVDLGDHRSRTFEQLSIASGDLLIGMEPKDGKTLLSLARRFDAQVTLLGLWLRCERPHIEDPFGLTKTYFHFCFTLIDSAVSEIAACLDSGR